MLEMSWPGFRGGLIPPIYTETTKNKRPKKYIIKRNITILLWPDDSKTIVRRTEEDEYNKKLGFLIAYFQKHSGLSKKKANDYLDSIKDMEELQNESN